MSVSKYNSEGYPDPTVFAAFTNIEAELRKARFRPIVYMCSPYSGDTEANIMNARRYCRFAVDSGCIPIAPHLLFPQFLGTEAVRHAEETEETRELALHMGLILLSKCHEVWYFGDTVSEGMKKELNRARWRNMVVRHFTDDCMEVPI